MRLTLGSKRLNTVSKQGLQPREMIVANGNNVGDGVGVIDLDGRRSAVDT